MPEKVEIDQELEKENAPNLDDEQEDDEAGEAENGRTAPNAVDKSTFVELNNNIASLKQVIGGLNGNKQQNATVSHVENALSALIKDGYKQSDLQALMLVVEAAQKDAETKVMAQMQRDKGANFEQQCFQKALDEADKFFAENGIEPTNNMREAVVKDAALLMQADPKFKGAVEAYARGQFPAQADFSKAIRLAGRIYGGRSSMVKDSGNKGTPQLDVKSSKSKAGNAANSGDEIDINSLTDVEREVYVATLNSTKNKAIALNALRTIAPKMK